MKKAKENPAATDGIRYRKALGARIVILADLSGGKRSLAQRIGIHESMLYRYIKGENALSAPLLVALAQAGGVSVDWLATGAGPAPGQASMLREPAAQSYRAARFNSAEYQVVPYGVNETGTPSARGALAFAADWLARNFDARGAELCLIEVRDEGMEPTLRSGDLVLIDRRVQRVAQDGLYALRQADGVEIRRVQKLPGGRIKVASDNPNYQSITLTRAAAGRSVRILGRVLWYGRRV